MIDLKPFCADETDPRDYIRTPFTRGDYTYATNGHILIRVIRRLDVADDGSPLKIDNLLAECEPRWHDPDAKLAPIPDPILIHQPDRKCGACNGSGECKCDCGHEHTCGSCGGAGQWPQKTIARFPNQDLALDYINLIRTLPGIAIAFGNDSQLAVFRFEGGVGCLMPMRTREIPSDSKTRETEAA